MKVKYSFIISMIFALFTILGLIMYRKYGWHVNEEGLYVEQFFVFIPIAFLCAMMSAVFGVYWLDVKGFVKLNYSCINCMIIALLSFVTYHLTHGNYDKFALKPIGFFFTFLAVFCGVCLFVRNMINHFKKEGISKKRRSIIENNNNV